MSARWPGFGRATLPKHAADYAGAHALTAAAIRAAGIRHLDESQAANVVGTLEDGATSDALAIPFPGTTGGVVRFLKDGAKPKFKAPIEWEPRMYLAPFPPGHRLNWTRIKRDPREKLYWAEGPLKALCLTWRGIAAIAFSGLDGYSRDRVPIGDFDLFVWKGRVVVLVVDSDAATKIEARRSIKRQADHLRSLGAEVRVVIIPSLDDGAKTDVNDFVAKRGINSLLALEETLLPVDWTAHNATRELNCRHAFVMLDGKATILTEEDDPEYPGTKKIALSRPNDVRDLYANQLVEHGPPNANGNRDCATKFAIWFRDPHRRAVRRIWLQPGATWGIDPATADFNLWQGWAIEPHKPGVNHRWNRLRDHIAEVIADGDATIAAYVLDWLAHGVQHPATLPEVAVVTIGGEGTGKGILWRSYGRVYGRHYMHLVQKSQLVGNFNDFHKDKLLVYADESFYAGDHAAANVLKAMITEPTMMIEPKFVNAYSLPNYRKLVISSNETWVVPADADARRYAVLRVSERRKGDFSYFKAIVAELEGGGYEAMLYDLLHRDLTRFDPRRIPQTSALLDQKKLTWDPIINWWFEKLVDGTLGVSPTGSSWEGFCFRSHAANEVITAAGPRYERRSLETRIGMSLRKLCPSVRDERRLNGLGKQGRGYWFPALEVCRNAFADYCRTPIDWEREAGRINRRSK